MEKEDKQKPGRQRVAASSVAWGWFTFSRVKCAKFVFAHVETKS